MNQKNLSRDRKDLENIVGFRTKKFTAVNMFFTGICGTLLTVIFYLCLMPFHNKGIDMIDMFFHGGTTFQRSTIPYYTMFFTFWAIAILLDKLQKLKIQREALKLEILPEDPAFVLTPLTAKEILANIDRQVDFPSQFLLLDRMRRALSNLKNLGSVSSVAECLNTQANNDNDNLSSSYTVLKGFIWAIPVLGFIGTVLGLSEAVGKFGKVVSTGADIATLKSSLGQVTGGLSVAFETTLIALVAALIVQLLMTMVVNKEEDFLDECADYCHKNIVSKLKLGSLMESDN